jgi:hypothetical protein
MRHIESESKYSKKKTLLKDYNFLGSHFSAKCDDSVFYPELEGKEKKEGRSRKNVSPSFPFSKSESESELVYDWLFTANQFILAISRLRLMTSNFLFSD